MQQAVELAVEGKTLRGMYHLPEPAGVRGPLVILFHGFTGNKLEPHRIFLKLSRRLADQGIAALRFDFSGSGESDGDFEEMTFFREVKEAGAILDYARSLPQVDPSRIGLVGLSMGGAVAATLAGERPSDIKALSLWSAATDSYMRQLMIPRLPTLLQDERGCYDWDGNLVHPRFLDEMGRWNPVDTVSKFQGPVLILHGSRDETIPQEAAFKYYRALPGRARLKIIEDADHTYNRHDWERTVLEQTGAFFKETL